MSSALRLPSVFGDGMVLQRDMPVLVWGWANPGTKVAVAFAGQERNTVADELGEWSIKLAPLAACKEPRELTVSGDGELVFKNVLVGEVWLCSGQSNMAAVVNECLNLQAERAGADLPTIRHFTANRLYSVLPLTDGAGPLWDVCSPDTVPWFSGVGFFFARELAARLDVPVGLINSSYGATRIEPWINNEGFHLVPELADLARQADDLEESGARKYAEHLQRLKAWLPKVERALVDRRPLPEQPLPPGAPGYAEERQEPTRLYNAMIHPLAPFAIRGALWYQGESNNPIYGLDDNGLYYHKMRALIGGWRKLWGQGDFPFYYVQLANFNRSSLDNPEGGEEWAALREAQLRALTIPNTGMAVSIDIGDADDIHPKNKQDVAHRLALWALAKDFGETVAFSGPLYQGHTVEDGRIRVAFAHASSGLMAGEKRGLEPVIELADGKLGWFSIAGEDRNWFWADVAIDGQTLLVSSPRVRNPVAVRYAYVMNPEGLHLYNRAGLPASPFRSDAW
ncbi:MAG: sialate O-acetylesterase [Verrucomicrobiae bacterium]